MSAEETAELREELVGAERPESTDAAEEFLQELRDRGILEED